MYLLRVPSSYIYNVLGNRVSREVNQTTTYEMFYDGADCVGDDDGSTQRYFITPGLDENLLLNDGSDDYYYTQDGLGSVRELVDTDQDTQNSYDYEAFGSAYNWSTSLTNRYTYTGREWDSESSTYYYRARCYLPSQGRFSQVDIIDGANRYLYAGNTPTVLTDPLGLWVHVKGNIYRASSNTDTLKGLTQRFAASTEDWVCIWPVETKKKDLKQIRTGDCYDASNLKATSGPSLYIDMDAISTVYNQERPTAKVLNTGDEVYNEIKRVSGEGATPIDYFELYGHTMNRPCIGPPSTKVDKRSKKGLKVQEFCPANYPSDNSTNTYERAKRRKGPHRCWFTRGATGYAFACGGLSFGKAFAGAFLRKSASIKTTPQSVRIHLNDAWIHYNDWGFEPVGGNGKVKWYSNFKQFLKAKEWVTTSGQL